MAQVLGNRTKEGAAGAGFDREPHPLYPQDRTVVEFHSYTHQDCDKHKKADALIGGSLDKTPGAMEAVAACTSLLDAYRRDEPWSYVQGFLRDSVFELFELPHPSSPGAQF